MLTNFHTHTTFCDGESTPEEIVRYAIDRGFSAIGFSGHGYTPFDESYCIKDIPAYKDEVRRLKGRYRDKIQIYLGVEEDAFAPAGRGEFDYIIGSAHYVCAGGTYYSMDDSPAAFATCLSLFDGKADRLAEAYYDEFCRYIALRRPDVVGHFDLITKFEEMMPPVFTKDGSYRRIAEAAMDKALACDVLFEVNTGAIERGVRTVPYPSEELLHLIRKRGGKLVLSSDSHRADTLDAYFTETKRWLRSIGFREVYALYDGRWTATAL